MAAGVLDGGIYVVDRSDPDDAQMLAQAVADNPDSLTGAFLSGRRRIAYPKERRVAQPGKVLRIVDTLLDLLNGGAMDFSEAAFFQARENLLAAHEELRQQIDLAHR